MHYTMSVAPPRLNWPGGGGKRCLGRMELARFRGRLKTVGTKRSDVDPLDLVERDLVVQPVVELGGAGGLVPRDPCRDLEVAAVSQVLGDPGAAKAVGADLGGEPRQSGRGA